MGEVYPFRPGHVAGSDTSEAAADSMERPAVSLRQQVLDLIQNKGVTGATDDEIEVALNMKHQTASARRRELVLHDLIVDSGERRPTRSGRKAAVWITVATMYG